MSDAFAEPLDHLLSDVCRTEDQRAFARGASTERLWNEIAALGYHDALTPADRGGLGLSWAELTDVLVAAGKRGCPIPLGETMAARALLARAEIAPPDGPILLASPQCQRDGVLSFRAAPLALASQHALLDLGDRYALMSIDDADVTPVAPELSLAADMSWPSAASARAEIANAGRELRMICAVLRAATIAGLAQSVFDLTLSYGRARKQFGRPIVDFQAIQHHLAVMAEESAAAFTAASIALDCEDLDICPFAAAVAKMRASSAAERISALAHAVHGAIGVSGEYDLQLFTRRLYEERMADGAETYWAERIGQQRLTSAEANSVAFVRKTLMARASVESELNY